MSTSDWLRTGIGATTADSITIRGRDLAGELMGSVSLHRAVVPARAGRRAHAGAGPAARRRAGLAGRPRPHAHGPGRPAHLHRRAGVAPGRGRGRAARRGLRVPGSGRGHGRVPRPDRRGQLPARATPTCAPRPTPPSPPGAPRAAASPASATRSTRSRTRARRGSTRSRRRPDCSAPTCARSRWWPTASARQSGRTLPINGAGAGGAALADLGFAPAIVRGFALLARTAGLVAHLAEEMAQPMGMPLFREIDERVTYDPGAVPGSPELGGEVVVPAQGVEQPLERDPVPVPAAACPGSST